jgi:hypothetical protein
MGDRWIQTAYNGANSRRFFSEQNCPAFDFTTFATRLRPECDPSVTLLFAQGVNPRSASEMLGHSDIAITLRLYDHVTPSMHQEAASTADKLFQDPDANGSSSGLASWLA